MSDRERLRQTRENLQKEIRLALNCRTDREKIDLVKRWKSQYSPIHVAELLRVAKNRETASKILEWDLNKM